MNHHLNNVVNKFLAQIVHIKFHIKQGKKKLFSKFNSLNMVSLKKMLRRGRGEYIHCIQKMLKENQCSLPIQMHLQC